MLRNPSSMLHAALLVVTASLLVGCIELKQAGTTIGHTSRDAAKSIGSISRDVAEDVGRASVDAAKVVGRGAQRVYATVVEDAGPEDEK